MLGISNFVELLSLVCWISMPRLAGSRPTIQYDTDSIVERAKNIFGCES